MNLGEGFWFCFFTRSIDLTLDVRACEELWDEIGMCGREAVMQQACEEPRSSSLLELRRAESEESEAIAAGCFLALHVASNTVFSAFFLLRAVTVTHLWLPGRKGWSSSSSWCGWRESLLLCWLWDNTESVRGPSGATSQSSAGFRCHSSGLCSELLCWLGSIRATVAALTGGPTPEPYSTEVLPGLGSNDCWLGWQEWGVCCLWRGPAALAWNYSELFVGRRQQLHEAAISGNFCCAQCRDWEFPILDLSWTPVCAQRSCECTISESSRSGWMGSCAAWSSDWQCCDVGGLELGDLWGHSRAVLWLYEVLCRDLCVSEVFRYFRMPIFKYLVQFLGCED